MNDKRDMRELTLSDIRFRRVNVRRGSPRKSDQVPVEYATMRIPKRMASRKRAAIRELSRSRSIRVYREPESSILCLHWEKTKQVAYRDGVRHDVVSSPCITGAEGEK